MISHQQVYLQIVVVEDEADIRTLLVQMLSFAIGLGKVQAFSSAEDALPLLQGGTIDLLVTDYNLPGMDGAALIRLFKAAAPTTPVAMITGYFSPSVQREARAAGAQYVLAKPFDLDQITALVEAVVLSRGPKK